MEQVALTNPVTEDRTLPAVTFCTWTLGTLVCALLSFLNQFFFFRREPLSITSIFAKIAVASLRHLIAATLTCSASSGMTWDRRRLVLIGVVLGGVAGVQWKLIRVKTDGSGRIGRRRRKITVLAGGR
ncbi:hypothetical protein RHGRI_027255 [Rhododendron griersonianum]|uniref:Uncharacterized protein n=1 Tax=Rhododendron griersonianum TaxID=479676 RepID=A0AAV6IWL6_9ERIC|nr:hypothetical protein RHGRI_027255 [Rhododendron griersonianum]